MKTSVKKQSGSKISIDVTVTAVEFRPYWDNTYMSAASHVNLKGFRPGAAPKELLDQAINKEVVFQEALEAAVRGTLHKISDENDWTVIEQPKIEVYSAAGLPADEKAELKFKADFTIFPEIALPDYKKIAAKVMTEKKEASVSDDEVKKSFDWLRKSRATEIRVARPAKKGDLVDIGIEVSSGGAVLPKGGTKSDRFELGEGKFIPGFEEHVENHSEGEEIKFSVTAPADYWQKDLQGKQLDFSVKMNGVFELKLPEENDDFAKSLGKFESLGDLKKNITNGLKAEKEQKENDKLRIKALEEITEKSKIDVPEIFVERTLDGMVEDLRPSIEASGQKIDDAKKELRKTAEKRVASHMVLYEIAKKEHLEPTKEEIEEESKLHARETRGMDPGKFYDYIYGILINRKVFKFLEDQK